MNQIFVTEPDLPPLDELIPYLEDIWRRKILTNGGKHHKDFELSLANHLGVENISLVSNGTLGLVIALKALELNAGSEVITTPYSFVATSHILAWNQLTPVFADIEEDSFNINPKNIEPLINENTKAILAVHCYGNPCNTEQIKKIADRHKLKVIYDAAHAFDVKKSGATILNSGDISVLSFHATKVFNTFEGGAIVCKDRYTKNIIDKLKNFGFVDEVNVSRIGINAKMNEFNAAIGLLQLKNITSLILSRKKIFENYNSYLKNINGIKLIGFTDDIETNYSYYPILIEENFSISRDELYESFKKIGVFTRRYFYPLISNFPMYQNLPTAAQSCLPIANRVAEKILCLPIYPSLTTTDQTSIINHIRNYS